MKKIIPALLAAFALLEVGGDAQAQSREFDCGGQSVLKVKVLNPNTIAVGPIEGRMVALRQSQQAMTYVYGEVRLDIAQDQRSVRLTVPGGSPMNCTWSGASNTTASVGGTQTNRPPPVSAGTSGNTASASPPADNSGGATQSATRGVAAKSWGGMVRSGPGMEHRKLAGLQEGDPITLLEQTQVVMNGYPWFKIRYHDNKTGYQWGGIICAIGKPLQGTFEVCN